MSRMSRVTAVTLYIANVRRYNQLGANGLKDKRHQHPGTQPLLSVVEQAQLLQTLRTPTADGGLWNSHKVAEWMSNLRLASRSAYKGVGTIYVRWSFAYGYPDRNTTLLTLKSKKLGKKTARAS
jgi:hypothetical protein